MYYKIFKCVTSIKDGVASTSKTEIDEKIGKASAQAKVDKLNEYELNKALNPNLITSYVAIRVDMG